MKIACTFPPDLGATFSFVLLLAARYTFLPHATGVELAKRKKVKEGEEMREEEAFDAGSPE